jgi:hypothetical protein
MNDQAENSTPTCPECIKLRKEIEDLRAIIFDLQQRLNRNSSNSSIPPSANPLSPHISSVGFLYTHQRIFMRLMSFFTNWK